MRETSLSASMFEQYYDLGENHSLELLAKCLHCSFGSTGGSSCTKGAKYSTIVLEMMCRVLATNKPRHLITNLSWRLVTIMETVSPHPADGKTCIYRLIDPETGLIRYVGKANDPDVRLKNHMRGCHLEKSQKNSWLISLQQKHLLPILETIEEVSLACWEEREQYWIRTYREAGFPLTNGTDGGNGWRGLSEEAKEKRRAAKRGKKQSSQHIQRRVSAQKGKPRSSAIIAKMRAAATGKRKTAAQCTEMSVRAKALGIRPSSQARAILVEKIKGKSVPADVLAKKRATTAERKQAGMYTTPRKPLPPEAILRRAATLREKNRLKREATPDHEPEISVLLFAEYVAMGTKRSLAKLAVKRRQEGRAIGVSRLKFYSQHYHWRERLVEYDRQQEEGCA